MDESSFKIFINVEYGAKRLEAPPEVRKALAEYEAEVGKILMDFIESHGGFRP